MWFLAEQDCEDAYTVISPQINADGNHEWPFDPSFPIEVRSFRFGGRNRIRMNRHDYSELLFLLSGELMWQIQERQVVQKEGDLIVVGSTLYHRPWGPENVPVYAVVLYFLPELIQHGDLTGEAQEYLMPFRIQDSTFPHVIPSRTGLPLCTLDLMKKIQAELPAVTNLSRLSVKTYLKMILISLVKYYYDYQSTQEVLAQRQESIQRLQPLFQLLERRSQEVIAIQDAARAVGMSTSHFRRFFRKVTGQSFITYVNHFRIAKAQQLLISTEKSIAEISQEVGFCDQSYFGLVFRQLVHMTPLQYRKNAHGLQGANLLPNDGPSSLPATQRVLRLNQDKIIEEKRSPRTFWRDHASSQLRHRPPAIP